MDDVRQSLLGMYDMGWCASMPTDINAKFQSTALMYVMNSFLKPREEFEGLKALTKDYSTLEGM
jgi:hypothetical protein